MEGRISAPTPRAIGNGRIAQMAAGVCVSEYRLTSTSGEMTP